MLSARVLSWPAQRRSVLRIIHCSLIASSVSSSRAVNTETEAEAAFHGVGNAQAPAPAMHTSRRHSACFHLQWSLHFAKHLLLCQALPHTALNGPSAVQKNTTSSPVLIGGAQWRSFIVRKNVTRC